MRNVLAKSEDLHFVQWLKNFSSNFVEVVLRPRYCLQDTIDQVFIVYVQSSCSLDLPNDIVLPQQLEQPVVSFILHNTDFANELHVWIYSDPEHGIVVKFTTQENVFSL